MERGAGVTNTPLRFTSLYNLCTRTDVGTTSRSEQDACLESRQPGDSSGVKGQRRTCRPKNG